MKPTMERTRATRLRRTSGLVRRAAVSIAAAALPGVGCAHEASMPGGGPVAAPRCVVQLDGAVFASTWSVTIVGHDEGACAQAGAARTVVEAALQRTDAALSSWRSDSEIAQLNAAPGSTWRIASPLLVSTLDAAQRVAHVSDGAFDVTVGPLLDVWGLSARTRGRTTTAPSAEEVEAARTRVGPDGLQLQHDGAAAIRVRRTRADVVVDATSVTDGAAAGEVMRALRRTGLRDILVEVAGEVVGAGRGPHGPWRVGLSTPDPDKPATELLRSVVLAPPDGQLLALSTSGTTRDVIALREGDTPHLVDPRTGQPVRHGLVACTVVHPDVVVADALSTACVVVGEAGIARLWHDVPGAEALWVTVDADGRFATHTTAAFPPLD